MNIWLVTIGEPVPVGDGSKDRLHRTGYFARFLAGHGHRVTWWTSTFDHFRKKHWFPADHTVHRGEQLEIRMLHGCGYSSNVSLARFRDHRQIGFKFARLVRAQSARPDIVLAALPTIELCAEAVAYGKERGVPVVLDMRDMWPDIFVDTAPAPARPVARLLLAPLFRQARTACAGATAITGITELFVEWGLRRGGRTRSPLDRSFPMGYVSTPPAAEAIRKAEQYWDNLGVPANPSGFLVCFFGTFGRQLDLETVLRAARRLQSLGKPIRFVLCGSGDRLDYFRRAAADLKNVMLPGWVDAAAMYVLMRRSKVGLDPLPSRYDFLATINNKAIEYTSAGLPVISSPNRGVLAELLAREQCGLSYDDGNADALAGLLSQLCDEPARVEQMSRNSVGLFHRMFTAERVYGEMMAHLEQIAAGAGKSSLLQGVAA